MNAVVVVRGLCASARWEHLAFVLKLSRLLLLGEHRSPAAITAAASGGDPANRGIVSRGRSDRDGAR